ncbi:MAG: CHAT domain-containing protein [Cyanobacteria bacterium P01_F01_bin.53]
MQKSRRWLVRAAVLWPVPIGFVAGLVAVSPAAQAQVVPTAEGAGTTVAQDGDQYDISGGTQAGGNLFHEFDDFSLTAAETANFAGDSGVFNIVGQVSAANPSYIDGQVQVSGTDADLYLINPSGVFFGPDAQLSLGGSFTATTADQVGFGEAWLDVLSDQTDYTQLTAEPSSFRFTAEVPSAVINQGDLAVAEGESLVFMGGHVLNDGDLDAPGGEIGLVAVGGESTVRFGMPGSLLSLEIDEQSVSPNAAATLSQTDLPALITGSPNAAAASLNVGADGVVRISGFPVESEEVVTTGEISTRPLTGDGGTIALLGDSIDVLSSVIDASGETGGTVLVGRGLPDQESLPMARVIISDQDSVIRADGLTGAGGNVVVGARGIARVFGTVSAQGATQGGFIETSAERLNLSDVSIDASGQSEGGGRWLVDPVDIEIVNSVSDFNVFNEIDPSLIAATLDSGVDVEITTTPSGSGGDIFLSDSIVQTGASTANLTLTGRRFSTNGSTIDFASTGELTFGLNAVNPELNTDSSSIENAIAAIGNVNGARRISLGAGTYDFANTLNINTAVEIEGASRATTLLNDAGGNRLFAVSSNGDVGFANLTFSGSDTAGRGGGISNVGGMLRIDNSTFVDNVASTGGAISNNTGGSLAVSSTQFIGNQAQGSGGAVFVGNDSVGEFRDVFFQSNSAGDDAGALFVKGSKVSVFDSVFASNQSADDGGALGVQGSDDVTFDGVSFDNNVSLSSGGAITTWAGSTLTLRDTTLEGNTAISSGGAIFSVDGSNLLLSDSQVNNNQVFSGRGGGLHVENSVVTLNSDSVLNGNTASANGGALSFQNSLAVVEDTSLSNNTAGADGGGISLVNGSTASLRNAVFENNSASDDGGGLSLAQNSEVTVEDTQFVGNSAVSGGGLRGADASTVMVEGGSFTNNSAVDGEGGAIAIDASKASLQSVDIFDNTAATNGGGVAQRAGALVINGSDLRRNEANGNGGAIAITEAATTTLEGSTLLIDNEAGSHGGGLATKGTGSLDIEDAFWSGNQAADSGGGLYQASSGNLTIESMTFQGNTAGVDGGALSLYGEGTVTIGNVTVNENQAQRNGGGLHVTDGRSVTLASAAVLDNVAGNDGGGLYQSGSSELKGSVTTVEGNRAGNEGGAITTNTTGGRLTLNNSSVTENAAVNGGGAIVAQGETAVDLSGLLFRSNEAEMGEGGALAVGDDASLSVVNTTFETNKAAAQGGAIYTDSTGAVEITSGTFLGNQAVVAGGAIAHNATGETLVIQAVNFEDNTTSEKGGAIFASAGTRTSLRGAQFDNNQAGSDGGALYGEGELIVENSSFEGNQADENGGAIYSIGDNTVTDSTFNGNEAANGGGLALNDNATLGLVDTVVTNNRAVAANSLPLEGYGGGLAAGGNSTINVRGTLTTDANGVATASSTVFEGNTAVEDGGGISTMFDALLVVEGSLFRGNTAGDDGGGVAVLMDSHGTIVDSNFENNLTNDRGGGLYSNTFGAHAGEKIVVENSRFINNQSNNVGGGFHSGLGGTARVSNSVFQGNQATVSGGGLVAEEDITIDAIEVIDNTAGDFGGGFYLVDSAATVAASRFEGNQATIGGGLFTVATDLTLSDTQLVNNQAADDGGGLRLSAGSTSTIENSQFTDNQARFGGGLELSDGSSATLRDSSFTGNGAVLLGGGVQVDLDSRFVAQGVTFEGNQARSGGGLLNLGDTSLTNTTFSGNLASGVGGAISTLNSAAKLAISNSTVTQNSASTGGGIAESDTHAASLLNTIVAANSSSSGTAVDVSGRFDDQGNNLIGNGEGSTGLTVSLLVGSANNPVDPGLAPLADNGGPTKTHLLQADSLAVNSGRMDGSLPAIDQHGAARLVGSAVDIGAVELDAAGLLSQTSQTSQPIQPVDEIDPSILSNLDPTLAPSTFGEGFEEADEFNGPLANAFGREQTDDNAAVRRLESFFGRGFQDYWDLPDKADLSFDEVQAVLRRAQEEYAVNSAVVYAVFMPEEKREENSTDLLHLEPELAADDLLNLAVVMPEGELVSYALPVTRRDAERQVRMLRSTVSDPEDSFSHSPLTQQLYQWLLAPLEEDLAAQGIQNLMYALDRGLRTAPVTAMKDDAGYSLERYGISVVPSMGLMQTDFSEPVRRATVAMGVSEFEHEAPLPAVPIELAVLKDTVPVSQTILNEGTTAAALDAVKALEQPGVLHLATHAIFDPRSPESSYIQLWDDPLSMKEFSNLGWQASDLELLILSACSTALSSPNSELGFAGLAAASGVGASVGSLWQVSDVGTLALMGEFYAQLESTDLRYEALRQAQLALLKGETRIEGGNLVTSRGEVGLPDEWDLPAEATMDHPFFWSAFTMVGNPW